MSRTVDSVNSQIKFRKDYQPCDYQILETHLQFQLANNTTSVISELTIVPAQKQSDQTLVLDGELLQLKSIEINDVALNTDQFQYQNDQLTIWQPPQQKFILKTQVIIDPEANTSLSGLYQSSGKFCTQCEAEGFRRITFYLDRPDILSVFTTTIRAEKKHFPYLLSNGNPISKSELDNGFHEVVWHDPFPKPSYLFALVAGDFDLLEDSFTTCSNRNIDLKLYVDKGKLDQTQHAMKSLKNAMKWDEERFSREYDLDIYMVVAVGDFNMGAMENKGLNVFNTKYVLANNSTATDDDFLGVESVIGHEYFHNWTGNRVTCRDWFQLSLKEGLTVFRDQEFSSDLNSRAVKRIADVQIIKSVQFAEDAGPMSHPIRPDSYIEMNNFYTVTVYNKGAEVIRMIHTLLGENNFKKGMDCYFERHDGQAVTCDDFVKAMEDASGVDLKLFRNWYTQSGTPSVEVVSEIYQTQNHQFKLCLKQKQPANNQNDMGLFHIPVKVGFINLEGVPQQVKYQGEMGQEFVLELTESSQEFLFEEVNEPTRMSILRDFSAPVKLIRELHIEDLSDLFAFDNNEYAKWNSGQEMMSRIICNLYYHRLGRVEVIESDILKAVDAFAKLLNSNISEEFKALCLMLPSMTELENIEDNMDVLAMYHARKSFKKRLADALIKQFEQCYETCQSNLSGLNLVKGIGLRKLATISLEYIKLSTPISAQKYALEKFIQPDNMSEELAAFKILVDMDGLEEIAETFFERWKEEDLVLDKWFSTLAKSSQESAYENIKKLWSHPAMVHTNPNKVRALLGAFASNVPAFHQENGAGYQWYADRVVEIDGFNPQIAARLVSVFNRYKNYDKKRQELIASELKRIQKAPQLSNDVAEIVSKALS